MSDNKDVKSAKKPTGEAALWPNRNTAMGELFSLIDTDKSGTIETKELMQMVRLVKPETSDEEIVKQFVALDKSKDGKVQKNEFMEAYLAHFKADSEKDFHERMETTKKYLVRKPALGKVFDHFDLDKSGTLNRGEIYKMVKISKPKFTNEELSAIFDKMDTNHDHKVDRNEFILYYFKLTYNDTQSEFDERIEQTFEGRRKHKLQALFNMYDVDQNGYLDTNEFALMLKMNGRKAVSADDVLDTLIKIDKNHNKKVEYKEFLDYIGGLIAHMDDATFNKAVSNMMKAAPLAKQKESAHQQFAAKVIEASQHPTEKQSKMPAIASAPKDSEHAGKLDQSNAQHGKTHK